MFSPHYSTMLIKLTKLVAEVYSYNKNRVGNKLVTVFGTVTALLLITFSVLMSGHQYFGE